MNKENLLKMILWCNFFLFPLILHAEIKLPSIFGNHMVLQQETNVAIWGQALPGRTVSVVSSWDHEHYKTKSDNQGHWRLKIKTPKAGGPYVITLSDDSTLELKDILIGEVWLCSGQSNMEMPMKGFHNQPIAGSNEAIVTSNNKSIRLITVEQNKSQIPLDNFTGNWEECLPENVANFSATAYFFGKMLQQALGVPVGLICSSWGGTRIEPWFSEDGLKKFSWVNLQEKKEESFSKQTPTVLFNAMINPLVSYGIRGVIWYQGETNRKKPFEYQKLMPGLVENWRNEWNIGEFPFYYMQIAPYDYKEQGVNSAFLREAQLKASTVIPNSGMGCIMDCGEKDCIHPSNKKVAGNRLAYLALAKTYEKQGFGYSGPVLDQMTINGNHVNLTFLHAKHGLTCSGKKLNDFKVSGEDKRFYTANAVITKTGVTLFSPHVAEPVAVHYAFDDFVVGDLFNTEGLPASSFRTDEW